MQTDPTPAHAAKPCAAQRALLHAVAPGAHRVARLRQRARAVHARHVRLAVRLAHVRRAQPLPTAPEWWALITVGFVAGTWITGFTARKMGIADPGPIVWNEIVAIWLVMLFVIPATFVGQLWIFVALRFFDMLKPSPIRYFDRRVKSDSVL